MRALRFAPLLWASLAYGQDDAPEGAPGTPEADADGVAVEDPGSVGQPRPLAAPAEVDPYGVDLLRLELERLKLEVEAQKRKLELQEKELGKQRRGLADVRLKQAGEGNFKVELSGYYRARGYVFGSGKQQVDDAGNVTKGVGGRLYEDQPTSGQYLQQRLRMGVKFAWKDVASFNMHVNALDDVIWGDNADLSRTALFAADPSLTRYDGTEAPASFQVFRAWTEFKIPIGLFKIGRQSSHWGLGLLANDGDGFRNDFGESHYGATFDRIMFATNPVKIAQAITKKEETKEIPLFLAVAFDKLVTDPLSQYHGYRCKAGVDQATQPDKYDPRCDPGGTGITTRDHSWTTERNPGQRRPSWWADQRDDVNEMVYALIYRGANSTLYKKSMVDGQEVRRPAGTYDLTVGGYVIHRWQQETDSNVLILDGYVDTKVNGFLAQFEGVGIVGKTRGLTLPDSQNTEDPLAKKANVAGYVARLGYEKPKWKFVAESGYASGDDKVNDGLFTGRALDPDYNVGLLIYEEVLRAVTHELWAGDASGLRSRGGVYNSHYVNPRFYLYPMNNTQLILGWVMAWPDRADGAVLRCNAKDQARYGCPATADVPDHIGWELDLAVKHTFHDKIAVSMETGYAKVTKRVPLDAVGLNSSGNFWTFQARAAWLF